MADNEYENVFGLLAMMPQITDIAESVPLNSETLFCILFSNKYFVEARDKPRPSFLQEEAWKFQGLKGAMSGTNELSEMARSYWKSGLVSEQMITEQLRLSGMEHSYKGLLGLNTLAQTRRSSSGDSYRPYDQWIRARIPRYHQFIWMANGA
jgi:hypothetical protein